MERNEVYRLINGERAYQDDKWGTVEQNPHPIWRWCKIVEGELLEAFRASDDIATLDELRQVAAVCIAALEHLGCPPREGYNGAGQGQTAQPYTHRNGETEPPTMEGWYSIQHRQAWNWDGSAFVFVEVDMDGTSVYFVGQDDAIPTYNLDDAIRWYGPITPPWDSRTPDSAGHEGDAPKVVEAPPPA